MSLFYSVVLIQIGTECLRNKNGYSPIYKCLFIFLKSAIFFFNFFIYQNKSIFSNNTAVIESETDNLKKFAQITMANIERVFKSEYLICTCSVAINLATSLDSPSYLLNHFAVPFLANICTVLYSLFFTSIAALLQAMLQANTESFRYGLIEVRNRAV